MAEQPKPRHASRQKYARSVEEISRLIPHRYPFLMIDRIIEEAPGRCVALKNVTINECFFNGHFPGRPIMPGALLMEAMAQAGNFIDSSGGEAQEAAVTEAFLLSSQVKFHRPVVPGDQLIITCRFIAKAKDTVRFKSEAHVEGELVASATFLVMIRRNAAGEQQ